MQKKGWTLAIPFSAINYREDKLVQSEIPSCRPLDMLFQI